MCSSRSLSHLGLRIMRFCEYDAVEQDFYEGHVSSWCANIIRIVDSVSPRGEFVRCFLPCLVQFSIRKYHMSCILLSFLVLGLCRWKRWCLFPLLCLLPLGQGIQICWQLRWTIFLCVLGLRSVAYNWGTVQICCPKQVEMFGIFLLSDLHVKLLCDTGSAIFWFIDFFVLALFARTMVPLLLYGFLIWLGCWGLVCRL